MTQIRDLISSGYQNHLDQSEIAIGNILLKLIFIYESSRCLRVNYLWRIIRSQQNFYIYTYIYTFIYYLHFRPPFVRLGSVSQLPNTLPDCTKSDTRACPVLPYLLNLTNYNVDSSSLEWAHDDVIRWKYFLCNWPFVRGIHRWPVDFPHKDQWRRALEFSLICTWTNGWAINRDAGDSRRHHTHRNIIVMGTEALQWLRSHVFP